MLPGSKVRAARPRPPGAPHQSEQSLAARSPATGLGRGCGSPAALHYCPESRAAGRAGGRRQPRGSRRRAIWPIAVLPRGASGADLPWHPSASPY
eukprot:SAG31_NODE_276_length_18650_cov_5.821842_8_plen_95_part_00